MILNVGCGGASYSYRDLNCDVNCDLERPAEKIKGFVRADVRSLPFRSKSFCNCYCFHVLEHVREYTIAFKELLRVTQKLIIIKVPHRFSRNAREDETHVNFFNLSFFRDFLHGFNYDITLSRDKFLRPTEITVLVFL